MELTYNTRLPDDTARLRYWLSRRLLKRVLSRFRSVASSSLRVDPPCHDNFTPHGTRISLLSLSTHWIFLHATSRKATPRHVTHVTFHCTVLWQSENHNLNLILLVFLQFPAKTSGTYVQLRRLLMIFVRGRSFARVRLMMRRMMLKLKTVANLPVIVLKVLE